MRHEEEPRHFLESEIDDFIDTAYNFYKPPPGIPPLEPLQRKTIFTAIHSLSREILENSGYGQALNEVKDEVDTFLWQLKARNISWKAIEVQEKFPPHILDDVREISTRAFQGHIKEPDFQAYLERLPGKYGSVLLVFGMANFEIALQNFNEIESLIKQNIERLKE